VLLQVSDPGEFPSSHAVSKSFQAINCTELLVWQEVKDYFDLWVGHELGEGSVRRSQRTQRGNGRWWATLCVELSFTWQEFWLLPAGKIMSSPHVRDPMSEDFLKSCESRAVPDATRNIKAPRPNLIDHPKFYFCGDRRLLSAGLRVETEGVSKPGVKKNSFVNQI